MWSHDVLCARRHGRLRGLAVLRRGPGPAALVDLYAGEDDARAALAAGAVEWARARDAESLHAEVLAGGETARMLDRVGFFRREAGPGPVPYAPGSGVVAAAVREGRWWAMGGDRDV
jgi:hypothetical protein